MKIAIDIEGAELEALDALAKSEGTSRAALVGRAVRLLLAQNAHLDPSSAFGLWGKGKRDGMAYQARIRSEW